MMTRYLHTPLQCLCAIALSLITTLASAGPYPDRPITLVAPFPPGGAADVVARIVARKLEDQLGKSVVVENRPGAGSMVGALSVANAKPDGYTLLLGSNSTFTLNPAIVEKMPYDSKTAFEPIGKVGNVSLALIVNPAVTAQTVPELVKLIKANPEKYVYGSYGNGTTANFAGAMFNDMAGTQLVHVPYRGSTPAMMDLIGGQIPIAFDTIIATVPQLKNQKIKALAVTSPKRSQFLPDVPSLDELGYKGFDMTSWLCVVAPAGLPAEVRATLNKAIIAMMANKDTQEKLLGAGFEPELLLIDNWAAWVNAEVEKMRIIAKKSNIIAE